MTLETVEAGSWTQTAAAVGGIYIFAFDGSDSLVFMVDLGISGEVPKTDGDMPGGGGSGTPSGGGMPSGGGGGMPMSYEMPNGWLVRFSSVRMFDRDMQDIEQGIEPDIKITQQSSDKDDLIEKAIELIEK